ncbi:putative ABC transport system ATP-binding protein [Arcanobacterium wilhelmae]|uniref:ABC transport system ATP-binding protein n=1 Tax=Arcanobacterium wilhelmae TaxID=1803177 RepID=A0ABT9NBB1_9ACTO|nr:ATP-binding cassette domain-containing protein [Arcanobacterium wilhelmae]MDP9801005.1 putative ABC transport system ATP-binding protein [Arcanobacterium wilhelmae]WFN90365.1 ATP-binding cassette domain-containing protein [Arcanobacterium wilhelmae]
MSVLELEGISKAFHQRTADAFLALDRVDLGVADGDFITIVGGNGAGKSTLLNMVSGAILPDAGVVRIDGEDVTGLVEEERAALVARVFQDPMRGTAPRMTVAENMMLAAKRGGKRGMRVSMNEERRREFAQALAPLGLGLEERLDTEIGVLSGGQRQSVALIMATLKTPRLLLLDEHTAALDPKTAKAVLEFTAEVVERERLTAIMITHNLKDALAYGNRTIVMHHGRIVRDIAGAERAAMTDADLYQILSDLAEADA